MEIANRLIVILAAGILTENLLLTKFLGVCPLLGASEKISKSFAMGLTVFFTMLGATVFTYPIYTFVLIPLEITYMSTITFVLIIALFVQVLEMAIKKYIPPLYDSLGIYLPLTTTNCAVLGITLLNVGGDYNFGYALFNSFCAGLGFLMVLLIFSSIRERVDQSDVPAFLKGTPIMLISASIMALSFAGFNF